MKSFRTMFPVLGILAIVAGCSAETGANGGVDSANAVETKTALASDSTTTETKARGPHAGRPHHGSHGPDFLLLAALHEEIGLTEAQRTTLRDLVEQRRSKALSHRPDQARISQLAAAVRAGKVDPSPLPAAPVDADATIAERNAASAKSIATLHATLTKEQRTALVDRVTAKRGEGPGKDRGDGQRPPPGAGVGGDHGGPLGGLLEGIELTEAQKGALKASFEARKPSDADREAMKAKHEAVKAEMDAKLRSFVSDTFDATAFVAPPAGAPKIGPRPDHRAQELAAVVSVLDAAQREKLALKIEQGPTVRPEMPRNAK